MKPTISVITVVLNDVKGLEETYSSLRKNNDYYEWIVVDGGSDDGTREWIDNHQHCISKLVSGKDDGIYDAMNKGWEIATGEWVYFLNAGDILCCNLIELVATNNSCDLITGRVRLVDAHRRYMGLMHPSIRASRGDLIKSNCIAHQATLLKRDLIDRFGGYEKQYKIQGDFEYWIRLKINGVKFEFIENIVAEFSYNGKSSRRDGYLTAEAERRAILAKYAVVSPFKLVLMHVRLIFRYYFGSLAILLFPKAIVRIIREKINKDLLP